MGVPHGRGQRGPPKGSSPPARRTRSRRMTFVQRIWAPRWCRSGTAQLVHRTLHGLLVTGLLRLESQRDGVGHASLADLRAAVHVERPRLHQQRARRSCAGRAAAPPTAWPRPPTPPGRDRPAGRRAPAVTSTSSGTMDSSAAEIDGRDHGASRQAPRLGHARMHLAQAPVVARGGVNDSRRPAGVQVRMELLRRLGPVRRRRAPRAACSASTSPSASPRPRPARLDAGRRRHARSQQRRSWRATPPSARCLRSRPSRGPRLPPIQYVLPTSNSHGSERRCRTFSARAASIDGYGTGRMMLCCSASGLATRTSFGSAAS